MPQPLFHTNDKRDQPCLCLCFGFSQIILIFPFLLITLHFSQIGFTDDLTFMLNPPFKKTVLHYIMQPGQMQALYENISQKQHRKYFSQIYLSLQMIRPFDRSYGDNSSVTLSPGRIRIKFCLSLPLIWASTLCPFSSST